MPPDHWKHTGNEKFTVNGKTFYVPMYAPDDWDDGVSQAFPGEPAFRDDWHEIENEQAEMYCV